MNAKCSGRADIVGLYVKIADVGVNNVILL